MPEHTSYLHAAKRLVLLAPLLVACSTPSGTLKLVLGGETDTLTRSPAPTLLTIDAYDTSCNKTTLASVKLPAATIDLGDIDENQLATLVVTGTDDSGTTVVRGQSLPILFSSLESSSLPIFLQRTGEWARLPGPLSDERSSPLLSLIQSEYLFVGGGAPARLASTTQFYDFGQLVPSPMPPTLTLPDGSPLVPVSVAFSGPVALLIDAEGNAEYVDFTGAQPVSGATSPEASTPDGGTAPDGGHDGGTAPDGGDGGTSSEGPSFADVAGGQTVYGDDGQGHAVDYVVGATRTTGKPTKWVLVIDTSATSQQDVTGQLSWTELSTPRLGAAAAWAPGQGLVVAGGSASGDGVEIIPPGPGTTANSLAYPPDGTVGAGAALLDDHDVLLAGGLDPTGGGAATRSVDLSCTAQSCSPAAWSLLPAAIGDAQAFVLSPFCGGPSAPLTALVVGQDATGQARAFRVTMLAKGQRRCDDLRTNGCAPAATELPMKVPHPGGAASLSPMGSVAVFGGADVIESYVPAADP